MRWGSAVTWHIMAEHSWQHGTVLMEYTQMRVRMFISHNFGVLADKYGEGAKTFKHRWTQEWIQGQHVRGQGHWYWRTKPDLLKVRATTFCP